jgi:hypothetical protein
MSVATVSVSLAVQDGNRGERYNAIFEGPTAANIKRSTSWDVTQCSLVEVYRRFGETYCLYLQP